MSLKRWKLWSLTVHTVRTRFHLSLLFVAAFRHPRLPAQFLIVGLCVRFFVRFVLFLLLLSP